MSNSHRSRTCPHPRLPSLETLPSRDLTAPVAIVSQVANDEPVQLELGEVVAFGDAAYGTAPGLIFQLQNAGDVELETTNLLAGDGFRIWEPVQRILSPGETDTFEVRFDDFTIGPTGSQPVTLLTNAPNAREFTFYVSANRTFESDSVWGDFTGDHLVDLADVVELQTAIRTETVDQSYDIDGDARVDEADLRVLTETILNSRPGDTDLDRDVDFDDFLTLAANFGRSGTIWSDGNFNANDSIDFADFLALSGNFGFGTS